MKATLKEDGKGCQGGERGAFEGLGLALRLSGCQLAKKSFPLLLARCCLCHNHHGCEIVIVQLMVEKDDDGDVGDTAGVNKKPKKFKTVWHGFQGILKLSGRINQAGLKLSAGFSNTVCWTS